MDVVRNFLARYEQTREEELTLEEYLDLCKRDPLAYATAAERMLKAIGEPEIIDTRHDQRLSRIFGNKMVRIYPAFKDFYGLEEPIEQVVACFRHAAQGLEEKKQILYLLGPVGGGKSSIAERLKLLMEQVPFYALKGSPVNESPLGLFNNAEDAPLLEQQYGIAPRYLQRIMSPWAVKRLEEFGGDIRKFKVVKRFPSILRQCGIAKTEPGDENNQDISSLVGKIDIRKLETYAQDDPGCVQLLGRPVPGQPGPAGVRGNVQGADQGAAPAADGHPGRQLQGHRGFRRDPVRRHRDGPLQRERVEGVQEQQEQRSLPGPHLHRQGALLPARDRRGEDLREAHPQLVAQGRDLRARHAQDDGAVRGAHPPEGAGEFQRLQQDADLRRREPQGHRSQGEELPGIPRLRRASTRA